LDHLAFAADSGNVKAPPIGLGNANLSQVVLARPLRAAPAHRRIRFNNRDRILQKGYAVRLGAIGALVAFIAQASIVLNARNLVAAAALLGVLGRADRSKVAKWAGFLARARCLLVKVVAESVVVGLAAKLVAATASAVRRRADKDGVLCLVVGAQVVPDLVVWENVFVAPLILSRLVVVRGLASNCFARLVGVNFALEHRAARVHRTGLENLPGNLIISALPFLERVKIVADLTRAEARILCLSGGGDDTRHGGKGNKTQHV
jgi:hypothetical protein